MKLAILGGSFNPLHLGHVQMAQTVIDELGYDKILFIPAGIPPHKRLNCGASAQQRLEMTSLFCESEGTGKFEVEAFEVQRSGISYTIDTVNYLIEKYKDQLTGKLGLIMGEENASEFYLWKQAGEIAKKCSIIIVPRNIVKTQIDLTEFKNHATGDYKGDFNEVFDENGFPYDHQLISKPVMTVSSTQIRGCISTGKNVEEFLPSCVYKYIVDNNLYKNESELR